ncbi:copper transporter [Corynebacterium qintianiae]|uniref:Copper transporter n=1 Tax=Corynebacterium qintianiae TaxID=2709392 RepID=A0A7T0KP91_9CORY|nr:copper transporter [Corynebacterium qintianiae]QPK84149.1 copper transporter [Corynebacterium qintianiae]
MNGKKGQPGLVAAGLGWGLAAGLALGVLLVAPAMREVADGASGGASISGPEQANPRAEAAEAAKAEAAAANELLSAQAEEMVDGALEGRSIIVLRSAGVGDEEVAKQRWLLNTADSDDAGTITLTEKFTSQDAADELGSIIANSLPAGAQISVDNRAPGIHAGEALAAALSKDASGQPRASVEDRAFLLDTLAEAGFIEYEPGSVIAADSAVLMTGSNDGEQSFGDRTLADFAAAFRTAGAPLVVAAPGAGGNGEVPRVGYAGTEAGRVNTVFTLRDELS